MPRTTKADLLAELDRVRKLYHATTEQVRVLSNVDDWQNERTIDGERAWALFSMSAYYERDWNDEWTHEPSDWQTDGMPKGRIKDRTTWWKRGFREWPDEGELTKWSRRLWDNSLANPTTEKYAIVNPSNVMLVATFRGWAVWWLTWFQHVTFDVGLSDQDVLASFQRYCDRETRKAYHAGKDVCLMGAEDHWRWCGAEPDGDNESRSPPPCRCKHCKKHGLVRIAH